MQLSSKVLRQKPATCVRDVASGIKVAVPCNGPAASRQVAAMAAPPAVVVGELGPVATGRRWDYNQVQKIKRDEQSDDLPEPEKKAEIYVMLPMDIINVGELTEGNEVSFIRAPSLSSAKFDQQLLALKKAGADGVMMDVWWGIVERKGPKVYDFAAYMELFKKAAKFGLKVQAVMSFHAGGGNVGDGSCDIPLPPWVLEAGEALGDEIFYTDKKGGRDHECISLGCDHEPVLAGRTPLECYRDFVAEFRRQCEAHDLWGNVVREICVGTGPCGELRYPSYQEKGNKWSYMGATIGGADGFAIQRGIPGIGEFQCYDKFMLASLKGAALKVNPEWIEPPREGAGSYDFAPWETQFFALTDDAGWRTPYGQFFMEWYSNKLIQHGADVLDAVCPVAGHFKATGDKKPKVDVAVKVAGIHWWYKSRSHAAEMTAGYYNYWSHCGYEPIAKMLSDRGVGLSFTCIEMGDSENPDSRHCSPEGLVRQVVGAARKYGVQILAENALEGGLYNKESLDRMYRNAGVFERITLLRLSVNMFNPDEHAPEGVRIKQPLRSFLHRFRKGEAVAGLQEQASSSSAAANGSGICGSNAPQEAAVAAAQVATAAT